MVVAAVDTLFVIAAVGGLSVTVTKAHVMDPIRAFFKLHMPLIGYVLECPYCFSHWVAAGVALYMPLLPMTGVWAINYLLTVFYIVAGAAIVTGTIMRALLWHEAELDEARAQIDTLKETLREVAGVDQ